MQVEWTGVDYLWSAAGKVALARCAVALDGPRLTCVGCLARGKVALAGQGLDHGRAAVHVVDLVQRPLVQPGPGPVVVLRVCGTKRDEMHGGG